MQKVFLPAFQSLPRALGEGRLWAKAVGMLGGGERVTFVMGPVAGTWPLLDLWADVPCPLLPSFYKWFSP